MEPIVYIYQDHLQDFWNSGQSQCFGAAFEWKGEQVYHVYIKYPQVAPTGYSMPCLFRVVDTDDYGKAEDVALSVYASMPEEAKRVPVVIVCIHVEDTKVSSRAFIVDDGRIIEAVVKYVPRKSELYTRSKGLLEVGALESKKVLIVGLGSGGAPIAVELAKAGVGHFILMDFDRIELHNIARHICGVNELGRLKVNAVKDAILLKNPYAQVETYDIDMNKQLDILEKCVAESDLTIVATDEYASRYNINARLVKLGKVGLFGRAVTRAEGGDILRVRPGGPCYACLTGNPIYHQNDEITDVRWARELGVIPAYVSDEDAHAMVQVGLSTDIAPINNMMVKLALNELSRGIECGISSLIEELTYDYYIWANRRDFQFANWAPFNRNPNRHLTILRWYGVKLKKDSECLECR